MIIDIVIPSLNESGNLKILLPFLKEQLVNAKAKVIVVDSIQSNDQTKAICLQHDVIYLQSPKSQRASQMNLGAKKSDSEAIMFLHADVIPPSNFYELMLNCLEKHSCGMFAYRFDKEGIILNINSFFTQFDGFHSGGGDQCYFIKKSCFEQIGSFDEAYDVMEDFEFHNRIRASKFSYSILKEKAIVSARKYQKHSYLKINWCNLKMLLAFRREESPKNLAIRYRKYSLGLDKETKL